MRITPVSATMLLPIVLAMAALGARPATASATCIGADYYTSSDRGGRADSDQKLAAWKEAAGHAHLLCESNVEDGMVFRTTTEMQLGKIGFKTGWQSANPFGQINFEILRINGEDVLAGDVAITPGFEQHKVCGAGDGGSVWEFADAMAVANTLGGGSGAQIMAYAFRSDAAKQTVLDGQSLFSIDASMLNCKLEVVVKLAVPASGDVTLSVQVAVERDEGEEALNAGLTLEQTATELLVNTDRKTADGLRNATAGTSTILSMAKGFVCGSTETAVDSGAVTISIPGFPQDNVFEYRVTRENIKNCGFLYWDPLMRPFGEASGATSGTTSGALLVVLLFAIVLMAWTL